MHISMVDILYSSYNRCYYIIGTYKKQVLTYVIDLLIHPAMWDKTVKQTFAVANSDKYGM